MEKAKNIAHTHHQTPLGWVRIACSQHGITALQFIEKPDTVSHTQRPILIQCTAELDEYFDGKRTTFSVAIDIEGSTEFNKNVWAAVGEIPFGAVATYQNIAQSIHRPRAARAVGRANGANPIAIIIPCHRLVGTNGKLRGYAYGLARKKALLDLETKTLNELE